MSPFITALTQDRRFLKQANLAFRAIDSTVEVNTLGLENRLEYEHIKQQLGNVPDKFLKDFLPGGKANVKLRLINKQRKSISEEVSVYLWDDYVICSSVTSYDHANDNAFGRDFYPGADYCGQWVNLKDGVYGSNLLELFIYHTNSHPRDAHKALARKYHWDDLNSEAILLHSQKVDYRQSHTMPEDLDFEQHLGFLKELDSAVHRVCKYRNRTGTLRGAIVYCKSRDKEKPDIAWKAKFTTIPVVPYERVCSSDKGVNYFGIFTMAPEENYTRPTGRSYLLTRQL